MPAGLDPTTGKPFPKETETRTGTKVTENGGTDVEISVLAAQVAAALAPGSLVAGLLAANAVTSAAIAAGAVTTAKLGAKAVTTAKIDDLAVTAAQLAAGAVTAGKIAAGTIVNADIDAAAAIARSKLALPATVMTGALTAAATVGDLKPIIASVAAALVALGAVDSMT